MNWLLIFMLSVAVAMTTEQGSAKRLSQKSIDQVKFLAVALIEEESKEYRFPDLDKTLSNFAYDTYHKFDKMTLNDLRFNEISLTLSEPNTIVFNATRTDGNMSGNYNVTGIAKIKGLPNTNRYGQFKASLVVRGISVVISMEEISGSFRFSVLSCTVDQVKIFIDEEQSTESVQLGICGLKKYSKKDIENHISEKICLLLSSQLTSKLKGLIKGFEAMTTEQGSAKRLSQKSINKVKFLAVALIEEESKEYRFPDLDKTLSNFAYDTYHKFDKMTLNDLKFNETSLTLSKPNTVVFNATRADGNMSGNYNVTGIAKIKGLPNTNRYGQFKASLVVGGISVVISMEKISGSFRFSVLSCTVDQVKIIIDEDQSTESVELGICGLKKYSKKDIENHITEKICLLLSSQLTSKLNGLKKGFEAVAITIKQGSAKFRMSQKGIDTVKFLAVALIEEELKEYRFSDLDKTLSNVAYDTYYKFDKMTLNDLKFNETSLTLSAPNTVVFNATRADGNMSGNYNITGIAKIKGLPNANRYGQFKASLVVRGISVVISMEEISGSFRVSVLSCTVHSVKIIINEKQSTQSSWSGILSLKTDALKDIEDHITEKICLGLSSKLTSKLNSLIRDIEDFLLLRRNYLRKQIASIMELPLKRIGKQPIDILGVSIDLDLVNRPKVIKVNNTDCYVEAEIDGKCFPLSNPGIRYNIAREMLPDFPPSNAMVQLILGNYVLETLLHSVYETGLFNQTIDFDKFELGGFLKFIKFNARFISTITPGLSKFGFEGTEPLRVKLEASKSPSINLTPSGIDVEGSFIVSILIVNDSRANVTGTDRNAVLAFSLSLNINVSGSIAIKDDSKIVPRLNKLDFSLKILNDEPVNGVNLKPINFMLLVAKPTLLSTINDLFKDGIAIPAAFGFSLTKLEFSTVNRAAIIGADVGVNKNYDLQGLFEAIEDLN